MNDLLLDKIKAHIMEEPRRIIMSVWREQTTKRSLEAAVPLLNGISKYITVKAPPCGTIGCIAGWAQVLTKTTELGHPEIAARLVLGLDQEVANRLFLTRQWPLKFHKSYIRCKTAKGRAKVVCDRITHFQKTKGRE